MSWPTDPLEVVVELGLAADLTADPSTWDMTDATDLIYTRDKIVITRGRPDQSGTADTSTMACTANNRSEHWSTRNPASPWFGQLHKGTPIRVRASITDMFTRTTAASWGSRWTTSGGTASDYSTDGSTGKITLTSVNVARFVTRNAAAVQAQDCNLSVRVATSALATGAAQNAYVLGRVIDTSNCYQVRVAFGTDQTIKLSIEKRVAASTTTLVALTSTGLTHVANTYYRVRLQVTGSTIRARAWADTATEPTTWLVSTTDTSLTARGTVGLRAVLTTGNTNTNPVVSFDDFVFQTTRFAGFLSEIPPRWDVSGEDRYAPLRAKGRLYLMTRGASPAYSAMRRTIEASSPALYLPMEDGTDASTFLAVAGAAPVLAHRSTGIRPAAIAGPPGSANLADFDIGVGRMVVPVSAADTGFWSVSYLVSGSMAATPHPVLTSLQILTSTGTTYSISMYAGWVSGAFGTTGVDLLGILTTFGTDANVFDLDVHDIQVRFTRNGANIDYELWYDGVQVDTGSAAGTLGVPTQITVPSNDSGALDTIFVNNTGASLAINQLAVHTDPAVANFHYAAGGYFAEQAHTRFLRLCAEAGIPASSAAAESQEMSTQGIKTLLELVRECESADAAYLYEDLDWGLTLQGHTERENLATALALDYSAAGHIAPDLEPTDDDLNVINDAEVKRDGGSSSRLTEESTAAELSIVNIGRRDDSVTLPLAADDQTYTMAGWRLHLGTWPGYRYPQVALNFAAGPTATGGPSLLDDFCSDDLAFRSTIDNPPDDIGPDVVDLIIDGYTETLEPFGWDVAANCALFGPWAIGELATASPDTGEFVARLAADDSVLHAAINTTDTTMVVDPNGTFYTTLAADFDPDLQVRVGGEVIAVSSVATTAVTFVAAGTATHASNASVTPGMPAGVAADDLLLVFAGIRNSGAGIPVAPTGYLLLPAFDATSNVQLFGKIHSGSESAPAVSFTGGVANATTSAQMVAFRGGPHDINDVFVDSVSQLNGSAQNIAYPGLHVVRERLIALWLGWKQDDWTSVATLSGETEIGEPSSTTGDDQGLVWDYAIQTTPSHIGQGSFVVTGGASAISRSAVVVLAAGYQTFTVSARSVNGAVVSHAAGDLVEVANPFILGL